MNDQLAPGGAHYPSKRDTWIVVLIWLGAAMVVFAAFEQFSSDLPFWVRLPLFVVLIGAAAFMLWILYGTRYTLTPEWLHIACGPISYRVPLAQINAVRPTRNPLSSPACSLDRLRIEWQQNKKAILISPEPKADFLVELQKRCPQLQPQGDGLVDGARP